MALQTLPEIPTATMALQTLPEVPMPASGPGLSSAPRSFPERSLEFAAMGGRVRLQVACRPGQVEGAARDLRLVARRIEAWASRLTRFDTASELSGLNRCPDVAVTQVGPTLGSVLRHAQRLSERTEGAVDVGLLGARLAAEADGAAGVADGTGGPPAPPARWTVRAQARGGVVRRQGTVAFDLDGVGKGWIADRALGLLRSYPAALVDADGDIAVRTHPRSPWTLAIADPRSGDRDLAWLDLTGRPAPQRLGVATSGTSIHRWRDARGDRHHLIDPRTGRPADTDVVQATVIAESALAAESLAKSIVIRGSDEGLELVERAGALAEVVLLEDGQVLASPRSLQWLI